MITTSVLIASTMCHGTCILTCRSFDAGSVLTQLAVLPAVAAPGLQVVEVVLVLAQAAVPGLPALHMLLQALHHLLLAKLCSHASCAVGRGKSCSGSTQRAGGAPSARSILLVQT